MERLLITNGVGSLPTQIETVSDAFGRAFVRDSDAVWIISEGVAAHDVAEGKLVALPIDTSETTGPVGADDAHRYGADCTFANPGADYSRSGGSLGFFYLKQNLDRPRFTPDEFATVALIPILPFR